MQNYWQNKFSLILNNKKLKIINFCNTKLCLKFKLFYLNYKIKKIFEKKI